MPMLLVAMPGALRARKGPSRILFASNYKCLTSSNKKLVILFKCLLLLVVRHLFLVAMPLFLVKGTITDCILSGQRRVQLAGSHGACHMAETAVKISIILVKSATGAFMDLPKIRHLTTSNKKRLGGGLGWRPLLLVARSYL